MNQLLVCALAISLTSCGRGTAVVDARLSPYFEMFEQTIQVSTNGISGHLVSLVLPTIGQCVVDDHGNKDVQIDPTHWKTSTDTQRETLMFHELGHCAMDLVHVETLDKYGCPLSLMYPSLIEDSCFEVFRERYYKEMESYK